jgi:hypothetical protein
MADLPTLSRDELLRYSRHLILPGVELGQRRIKAARVLLVGAGGLGSPQRSILRRRVSALSVSSISTSSTLAISNDKCCTAQATLAGPSSVGARRITDLNPHVNVETHDTRLTSSNALDILGAYDIVVDGTDNFTTRYLTNDACVMLGKPNVMARSSGSWPGIGVRDAGWAVLSVRVPDAAAPGARPKLRGGRRARSAARTRRNHSSDRGAEAHTRRRRSARRAAPADRRVGHAIPHRAHSARSRVPRLRHARNHVTDRL